MREIELKFRIDDLDKLLDNLKKLKCKIGKIMNQNDTIYVSNLDDVESKEGSIWLRVRKENDKVQLNLKKQSAIIQEFKEIELEVDSYEKANQLLEILGYKKWVEVNKKRRYSKYKEYNLCIDEVERLGNFIEIELLIDEKDNNNYISELKEIAKELGINPDDIVNSHYDTMISKL